MRANVLLYFGLDNCSWMTNTFSASWLKHCLYFRILPSEIFIKITFFSACLTIVLYAYAMLCFIASSYSKFSTPTTSFYVFFFSQYFKYFVQNQIYRMANFLCTLSHFFLECVIGKDFPPSFSFSCLACISIFSNDFTFQPMFLIQDKEKQKYISIKLQQYSPLNESHIMVKARCLTVCYVYW